MDNEQGTMIEYSDEASPFFKINKSELEDFLKCDQQVSVKGWCNAYGFDIELLTADGVYMNYVKSQLSHQDPAIPRKATAVYEFHMTMNDGMNGELHFGNWSWIYFWLKRIKSNGHTFRMKDFNSDDLQNISELLKITHPEYCSLKNGKFTLKSISKIDLYRLKTCINFLRQ